MVITLNGIKKEMPSCFAELKTRHYERIITEWQFDKELPDRDFFLLFNILTDSDFKDFHATAENEVTIWNAIRWVVEQPFEFSSKIPKVLEIKGKIIDVPQNVRALSIGQNIHLRQLIAKSKYVESNLSNAVAIFLQPVYDGGKFDYDKAMDLKKEIEEMPAYLIRPIGFFLLRNVLTHGNGQTKFWQRIRNSLITLLERASLISPKYRGFTRMQT